MAKHIGIYVRVSSLKQSHASQEPDLKRYAEGQELPVQFYCDSFSGKTQERPGWRKLEKDMRAGKVAKLVCHKLDRLGRTARELLNLFAELRERKVDLVVVAAGINGQDSAEARLMIGIIANFAEYDNEVRSERIIAGQAAARERGVRWGGSLKNKPKKVTPEQATAIRNLKENGASIVAISKAVSLSRGTIYSVLKS